MRRDMDLIRQLMLKLEEVNDEPSAILHFEFDELSIEGFTTNQVEYHLDLLVESGLIDQGGHGFLDGFMFRRLTWEGHDFVDSVRDDEVWRKTRQGATAAGGFTLDLLKDLAKGFIKKQVEEKTGISLG
ncbi:DUF2513 domain-containing protein [Pseudomonas oryzihabitans]|uniref:DUF2513 domain-containing protein n=1 Tax=Pseudomonas oryzihabitans TaxID=47885 RepID=UPI00289580FC|nr:DUF2513 domain-containing protein [Pseudomonas oryzihabitans]MDT3722920.1 DUF2513 domain-containing protein [Pseudomonas oryzihabitans]